jgi:hypothetical protein
LLRFKRAAGTTTVIVTTATITMTARGAATAMTAGESGR